MRMKKWLHRIWSPTPKPKKFDPSRRGLIGAAALAPLVDPKIVMEQAGITNTLDGFYKNSVNPTSGSYSEEIDFITRSNYFSKVFMNGVPDYILDYLKNDVKSVRYLDPDTACLKSPSLAGKLFMQREKVLKRRIDELYTDMENNNPFGPHALVRKFREKTGLWL